MIDFNNFPSSGLQGVYRDRILTVDQLYERITNLNRYIDMMKKDIEKIRNKQNYYNLFINDSNLDTVSSKIIDSKQYEYKDYPKILKNSTFYFDTIRSNVSSSGSEEVSILTEYGKYEKFRNPLMNIYDSTLSGFNYNVFSSDVKATGETYFNRNRVYRNVNRNFLYKDVLNGVETEFKVFPEENFGDSIEDTKCYYLLANANLPLNILQLKDKNLKKVESYDFVEHEGAMLDGHLEQKNNVKVLLKNDYVYFRGSKGEYHQNRISNMSAISNRDSYTCKKNLTTSSGAMNVLNGSRFKRGTCKRISPGLFVYLYNDNSTARITVYIQNISSDSNGNNVSTNHEEYFFNLPIQFRPGIDSNIGVFYNKDYISERYSKGPVPKYDIEARDDGEKIYIVLTKSLDRFASARSAADSYIFASSDFAFVVFDKKTKTFDGRYNKARGFFIDKKNTQPDFSYVQPVTPKVEERLYFTYPMYNVDFSTLIKCLKTFRDDTTTPLSYAFHSKIVDAYFHVFEGSGQVKELENVICNQFNFDSMKNVVGGTSMFFESPKYGLFASLPSTIPYNQDSAYVGITKSYFANGQNGYSTDKVIFDQILERHEYTDMSLDNIVDINDSSFFGSPSISYPLGIVSHFIVAKHNVTDSSLTKKPFETTSVEKIGFGLNIDVHKFYFQKTKYLHKGKLIDDRMYYFYIAGGKLNVTTTWMMSSSDDFSGYNCVVPVGFKSDSTSNNHEAFCSFENNYNRFIVITEPDENTCNNLKLPFPCILFTLDTKYIYYIENIDSSFDKVNDIRIGFKELVPGSNINFRMFECMNDTVFLPVSHDCETFQWDKHYGPNPLSQNSMEYFVPKEFIFDGKEMRIPYFSSTHGLRTIKFNMHREYLCNRDDALDVNDKKPMVDDEKIWLRYSCAYKGILYVQYCCVLTWGGDDGYIGYEGGRKKIVFTYDGLVWNEYSDSDSNQEMQLTRRFDYKLACNESVKGNATGEYSSPNSIFSVSTEVYAKYPESIVPDGSLQLIEGNTFLYPSYFCNQDKSFLFITDYEEFTDPVLVSSSVPYAIGGDYIPPRHSLAIVLLGKLRTPLIPFAFYDTDIFNYDTPVDYTVECIVDVYVPSDLVWYYEKNKDNLFLKYNDNQNMTINIFDIRLFKQKDFGKLIEECEFKTPLSEGSFHTSITPPDKMTIKEGSTIALNFGGSGDAKIKIARLYKNLLNATDLCKSIWNIFDDYGNIVMYEDKFNEFFEVSRDEFVNDPGRFVFVVRIPANSGEFPDHGDVPDDSYLWVVIRDKSGKPIEAVFNSEDSTYRVDGAFDIFKSGGNFYSQEIDAEDVYVVDTKIVGKTDIVTDKMCSHEEPLTVYFTPYGETSKIKYNMEKYVSSDLKGLTYITGGKVEILVNGNRFGIRSLTTIGPDISDLRTSDVFTELDLSTGENIKYRPYQDTKRFQTRLRFEEDTKRVQLFPLFENYLDKRNDVYVSDISKAIHFLKTESYSPFTVTVYDKMNGYAKFIVDPAKHIVKTINKNSDNIDISICFLDKMSILNSETEYLEKIFFVQKERIIPFFITIDRKFSSGIMSEDNWDMYIDVTNNNNFKLGLHTMSDILLNGEEIAENVLITTSINFSDYNNAEFNYRSVAQNKMFMNIGDTENLYRYVVYKRSDEVYNTVKVER